MIKQSLNEQVKEYTDQLKKGQIQKAYKGIMTFMSGLKTFLENKYPEYSASALYFGYMDMTYFAFTPMELRTRNLKVAVVYLHEQNRFEVWLSAVNKKIQAEYIERFKKEDIGDYKLSQTLPGIDSVIEVQIVDLPDFDQAEELRLEIERKVIDFTENIAQKLKQIGAAPLR
jgi:hypothetical protein